MNKLKPFILEYESFPDQGNTDLFSYLYSHPQKGLSILSSYTSIFSDHFATTMVFVDISPSGGWSLIIYPS